LWFWCLVEQREALLSSRGSTIDEVLEVALVERYSSRQKAPSGATAGIGGPTTPVKEKSSRKKVAAAGGGLAAKTR